MNHKNKEKRKLQVAAELGLDKLVQKLIQKGVDDNYNDSEKRHIKIAKQLLQNKADINCEESHVTPLNVAIVNGHFEMVKFLIRRGSNVNLGQSSHFTNPLQKLAKNS